MKQIGSFTRKEDIIFTTPLSRFYYLRFSLGVLSICAYLRQEGFNNMILEPHKLFNWKHKFNDLNREEYQKLKKNFIEYIVKVRPKLLCFSCATKEFNETIDIIDSVRKFTDAKIIVGGYHANTKPEDFFTYKKGLVDFVVYGEGEITMVELTKALLKEKVSKEELSKIDGLVWKNKGKIIRNKPRALIQNLDILPVPAYDLLDMEKHTKIGGYIKGIPVRSFSMDTSRGCPYNCTFCACHAIFGKTIRFKSKERIEDEIRILKEKYGVENIFFNDDAFMVNQEHYKMVCGIVKKYDLLWDCLGRVDLINEKMIEIMKKSGGILINMGFESGSQRILNEIIKKGTTLEQAKNAVKICKKYGIQVFGSFMIGLPTETEKEVQQTIDFALDLDIDGYLTFITVPFPGTELYDITNVEVKPEDYYKLDFAKPEVYHKQPNKSEVRDIHKQFNKSEVRDLDEKLKEFRRMVMSKTVAKSIKNIPYYLKLWLKLPSKTKRIAYVARNIYGKFVFKPIFKRPLRV